MIEFNNLDMYIFTVIHHVTNGVSNKKARKTTAYS